MMKHVKFLMILPLGLLSSCTWGEKGAKEQFVLINVLDKKFFDDCRIVGSINMTMDDLEKKAKGLWDKNTEIVVYCANYKCTASAESAKILQNMGYNHVWAYEGGTAEWKHSGYPTEGPCKSGYLNDYEKPEGHKVEEGVNTISTEELKQKLEKFGKLK